MSTAVHMQDPDLSAGLPSVLQILPERYAYSEISGTSILI